VNHVYYGTIFLVAAAGERSEARLAETTLAGATLGELKAGLRTGGFTLQPWENRIAYAKARLAQAQADMASGSFAAALELIAA